MIQLKRGPTVSISSIVPYAGQPVYDTNSHILKIGDGSTSFQNLPTIGADPNIYKSNTAGTTSNPLYLVYADTIESPSNNIALSASANPCGNATVWWTGETWTSGASEPKLGTTSRPWNTAYIDNIKSKYISLDSSVNRATSQEASKNSSGSIQFDSRKMETT